MVSGASTITMQVARLLNDREPNFKNIEVIALLSPFVFEERNDISDTRTFGGNIEGVKAATLLYFNKLPVHFGIRSRAVSALPQSPARTRPDKTFRTKAAETKFYIDSGRKNYL